MKRNNLIKTIFAISLFFGILAGVNVVAYADTLRVDVGATHVPGFKRYCFQVINDDENESNPKHHIEPVASLTIKYISKEATSADHRFRGNITGPALWNPNVTILSKEQDVTWTFDGFFGAGSIQYTVDKPDNTIKPGDRSDIFSFVVNGEISVTEFSTGFQEAPGSYRTSSKALKPFGDVFLTNDNDTDFLRDKDGDGVADKFDDDIDRTK
ncbi:MAG: hypothetical protein GY941_20390 [Planctomycetes bacterium]|nr:hypothetical protein [Planctomycetota bacterium]